MPFPLAWTERQRKGVKMKKQKTELPNVSTERITQDGIPRQGWD